MANYANLEAAIQAAIYENNTNDITGAALQTVLLQMVSDMGKSGMLCNGVCDGNTVPPVAPDSNIFYIAPTGTYSNFGGLTVADGEWAIFIYNGGWQKQSIPVVTADAVPTTGSTNPVQSGGVADALDTKADIDGYYSTLTAGSAENLIGRGTVPAEYTRRTSGGSADIGSGAATIEKIHGNTIAWNQQIVNGNFADASNWTGRFSTTSASGGVLTATVSSTGTERGIYSTSTPIVYGHKYYIAVSVKAPINGTMNISIGGSNDGNSPAVVANTWVRCRKVYTCVTNSATAYFYALLIQSVSSGDTIQFKNYIAVDLTLMFGSGNEPTASEFARMFPLDWYTRNTGALINLTATGINTVGFNQWDEEWEQGSLDYTTGGDVVDASRIRSKNYIPVFGGMAYYFNVPSAYGQSRVAMYDAEKNYLGGGIGWEDIGGGGVLLTLNAQAAFIRFFVTKTTYNNDICINLSWSGYRNGEYEAYWDSTLALPITSVTSGGSAVFADGMKSGIGDGGAVAYDELTATKAVVRMEKVDMGSLSWSYNSLGWFWASLSPAAQANGGVICSKYAPCGDNGQGIYQNTADKVIGVTLTYINTPSRVYVRDTSAGTDAAAFKTAMNGVYLVYELATPVEYTLDSELNLNYRVDDFGTETLLPQNNATPTTAPIIYDVHYAMNAVDTLRNLPKNYISKDSMEHILNAMVTAGVISAYTLTWNAINENYDCTITA